MIDNQVEISEGRNKYTIKLAVPKYSSPEKSMQAKKESFFRLQMSTFNMFVVLSVVLILSATIIRAAPAPQDSNFDDDTSTPVVRTTQRSPFTCHGRTPCGWAVYTRWERTFEYYMKNNCNCAPSKICKMDDDSISISAYVYRCFNRTSSDPEDEDAYTKNIHF